MVRIVDEGEGVAQLARTPKTLFSSPPPRLFAAAATPARGAQGAPAPQRPKERGRDRTPNEIPVDMPRDTPNFLPVASTGLPPTKNAAPFSGAAFS